MARGGHGNKANSKESKKLDNGVKVVSEAISIAIKFYGIKNAPCYEVGHTNLTASRYSETVKEGAALPELKEMGITVGCMPDGGMWFDGPRSKIDRKLLAVFEAKHQKDGGNAIERWCKNFMLCKSITSNMKYHTLMTGEGVNPGGVLDKFSKSMLAANQENCAFYKSVDGFTEEEIFEIMKTALSLSLTFSQIEPFLSNKVSTKSKLNKETCPLTLEEIEENNKQVQMEISAENHFVTSIQNPSDPLTAVWREISTEDKIEAKEIIIDMIKEGNANAVIATEIVEIFNQ
jgi:hypothetical protein